MLELLRRWGAKQSQGMSVELVDARPAAADRVPQHDRQHDGGGRSAERHLRARRDHLRLVSREGHRPTCRIRRSRRAPTRRYEIDETLDLGDVAPMIAKPFSPGNAFPAEEVARERIDVRQGDDRLVHQRQLRRSAVGGAGRPRGARQQGADEGGESSSSIFPGSGGVERADRAARSAARRRVDCRRVPVGRRRDSRSRGAGRASARGPTRSTRASARSRRSIATGRTAWASAAKATSPARRSSPRRRSSATWRRRASSGLKWDPEEFGV